MVAMEVQVPKRALVTIIASLTSVHTLTMTLVFLIALDLQVPIILGMVVVVLLSEHLVFLILKVLLTRTEELLLPMGGPIVGTGVGVALVAHFGHGVNRSMVTEFKLPMVVLVLILARHAGHHGIPTVIVAATLETGVEVALEELLQLSLLVKLPLIFSCFAPSVAVVSVLGIHKGELVILVLCVQPKSKNLCLALVVELGTQLLRLALASLGLLAQVVCFL